MGNNDLISRAAAIKEIEDLMQYYRQIGAECDRDGALFARERIKKLPAVDAVTVVQRWISVKDRLPEVAGWYLVFYNESAMQVAFFKGKTWPFNNHYHTITHWMPLPEPPKMDGESDG